MSAVAGISSAESTPLQAIRQLLWNGKIDQARKLLERNDMEYSIARGVLNPVSSFRYGSPSEDSVTEIFLSLTKLEDATDTDPAVYDATVNAKLSEYDNDYDDVGLAVDPDDGIGIGYNTTYWQPVESSRDGVSYSDDRMSYGAFTGTGVKMKYDDPGTPTDGVDQEFSTGFSTKLEAISRDVYTGDYRVLGSYVHTWSDNGGYESSFSFGNLTLSPDENSSQTWTMNADDKA